jgi:chromosomal replication initiation ATPase DnaA
MNQLPLALPHRVSRRRIDFLASACNEAALGWIERWPHWPGFALVLYGPAGSGKSHLAELWRARSGAVPVAGAALGDSDPDALAGHRAVAVDDAEAAPERALLHVYNCCRESGASLLIVARRPPGGWPIALPDLASRLRAAAAVAIGAPDDALLSAILVKQFADRQLQPSPPVIAFLVRRMERSFAAAAQLAERIDRLSLGAKRPITLPLARRALAAEPP